jgi:hypothetical protein
MQDFRIVPAMHFERITRSCTRYGFPIFDHPLQDPKAGYFVATWETKAEADAAACCLGYLPNVVVPIGTFVPESTDD